MSCFVWLKSVLFNLLCVFGSFFKSVVVSCGEIMQAFKIMAMLVTLITDHWDTCGRLSIDISRRTRDRERERERERERDHYDVVVVLFLSFFFKNWRDNGKCIILPVFNHYFFSHRETVTGVKFHE